jgi:adenylate kinase
VCAKCGGSLVQRSDDNEATVRERLAVYRKKTMPLIEFYRARPTFRSVNGAETPERVADELARAVDGASNNGAGR